MSVISAIGSFKKYLACMPLLFVLLLPQSAYSAAKKLLVLGDSLSAEYGITRGGGWVALLEQRLQQKQIDYQVINASISGETSMGGKTRLPALLEKHKPAIVIIELGGNDALRGLSLDASEQNLRDMITASEKYHARTVLVGMRIPPNYGQDYAGRFFAMYSKIAHDMHSVLVPFLLQGVADKPELFQEDRIHLLAQAHPAILENVWAPLLPLLK